MTGFFSGLLAPRPSMWASALLAALMASPVSAAGIDRLGWLTGSWVGRDGETELEEHWTAPSGGSMIGMHRDLRGGRTVSFEFLRIVEDSLGLVYLASPRGRSPATPFRATTIEVRRVVFENPKHDFPKRILYWLERDGTLGARIEGDLDGKPAYEQWHWRRTRLSR